jgi:hypothetical protein
VKASPFWKGRIANATRFNARAGMLGFIRINNGTNETIFCFLLSSRAVCAMDRPDFSGRIFSGMPGFCRMLRGTTLSSGDESSKMPQASGTAKVQTKDRDMGAALRTVYQKTVEEDIPAEMLDLLGKLD